MKAIEVKKELAQLANPSRAKVSARFFKTGKGQYGEGDVFLGATVPDQRKVAYRHLALPFSEIQALLKSPIHEHRFVGLEILVAQYEKANVQEKKKIVNFYLKNTKYINNWDLVDTSAPYILGNYLLDKDIKILLKLATSKNLWERRIAIISTLAFVKHGKYKEILSAAKKLLNDDHDLIHKAVGWVLREVGKASLKDELDFLDRYSPKMPRTMLRYAIERFPKEKRKNYLLVK